MFDTASAARALLYAALASTALLLAAAAALRFVRQPARRARLIELALAGCLVLPFAQHAPGLPRLWLGWGSDTPLSPADAPAAAGADDVTPLPPAAERPALPADAERATPTDAAPARGADATPLAPPPRFELPSWEAALVAGYGLCAGALALWWAWGFARLARLHAATAPAPEHVRAAFDAIAGPAGRGVAVRASERVGLPVTYGLWRPVVVLPAGLCRAAPGRALRFCLAHEWGHVERRDARTTLLSALAQTLFFFQPLVWHLRRQLRLSQDILADRRAAEQAPSAEDYAAYLVALARTRCTAPSPALGMAGPRSSLARRILMLLDTRTPLERTCRPAWTLAAVAGIAALVAALAAVRLGPAPAQAAGPPPVAKEPAKALTYTGVVVEKGTGKPVPNAAVTVRRSVYTDPKTKGNTVLEESKHTTDEKGTYTFTIPPEQVAEPRLYIELDVSAPTHASKRGFGYALGMITKNEKLGSRPFFEKIELPPGEAVTGVIQTPDGKPAAGVEVQAFSRGEGERFYGSFDETTTDKDGKFRLVLASPGEAAIWIQPKDHAVTAHGLKDKRGDLGTFVLKDGVRLKGKLLDVKGNPVPDVWLEVERARAPDDEQLGGVADMVRRFTKTDDKGGFTADPLAPGDYRIRVRNHTMGKRGEYRRVELPGVFLYQRVALKAGGDQEAVEVRAVPHVILEAQYLDSKGNPRSGHDIHVHGRIDRESWFGQGDPDEKGKIRMMVPHGLTNAQVQLITNEHSSLRHRPGPGKPLSNETTIPLGAVEADIRGIEIIRYKAPIAIVKAVDADGKPVAGFTVTAAYGDDPKLAGNGGGGGGRGVRSISFERPQQDGRCRSSQLLPDEEFTIKVTAKGCKPQAQKLKLAEDTEKEVVVTLEKE